MRIGRWALLALMGCASTPRPADQLIQADIQERVLVEGDRLGECVTAFRRQNPNAKGKLLLQWHILPSGEARDVKAASDGPPELLSCLIKVFESMRFRETTTDSGRIVYPLKY